MKSVWSFLNQVSHEQIMSYCFLYYYRTFETAVWRFLLANHPHSTLHISAEICGVGNFSIILLVYVSSA